MRSGTGILPVQSHGQDGRATNAAPSIPGGRQNTLLGINREPWRSVLMATKTWSSLVIGTAPVHIVPPLVVELGTEKKYCEFGTDAIPCIVAQGVVYGAVSPEVQPVVSEP